MNDDNMPFVGGLLNPNDPLVKWVIENYPKIYVNLWKLILLPFLTVAIVVSCVMDSLTRGQVANSACCFWEIVCMQSMIAFLILIWAIRTKFTMKHWIAVIVLVLSICFISTLQFDAVIQMNPHPGNDFYYITAAGYYFLVFALMDAALMESMLRKTLTRTPWLAVNLLFCVDFHFALLDSAFVRAMSKLFTEDRKEFRRLLMIFCRDNGENTGEMIAQAYA